MSPPGFGGAPYSSPQERTLTAITDGREQTPKSAEEISRMLQTQQAQIRFLASNQKQMQKGINEATQNPVQQLQQFISDLIVLFGGGQLAQGVLDFGDLTYILPALGALFGFGDGPFPLNLIAAAEKFFFGYVVPTQAFTDLLNHFIGTWLEAFGIDEKFVADVKDLVTAVGELFDGVTGLLPNVNEFFGALGITAAGLGPLGLALAPIIKLFEAIDIKKFGNAVEFITDAIDPWIVQLTQIINFTNAVLHILGSGEDVLNSPLPQLTAPWANLIKFLGGINFAIANFNPLAAAQQFIGRLLIPLGGISEVQPDLQLDSSFDESSSIAEDSPAWAPQDLDPLVDYPEGWLWDLVGRNAPGSATVDCDGANHALLGTEIPVVEGQTFAPECWLTWSGVAAAGSTFRLQVMTDGGSATDIAAVSSPAASAGWTHLSGTYTVPAGVATIRTRLYVSGNATAGQVWFDDAPIRRTNILKQSFIQNLEDDLFGLLNNFATLIDGLLGGGHTMTDLVAAMRGLVSPVVDFLDGTAAGLLGVVFNSDGTAEYSAALLGNNPINNLIDAADGTAMSIGAALQNLVNPAGVTNYVRDSWNALVQNTGLQNASQLVSSLAGVIPAALDNLDGTAIATGVAQIQHNLDGTATMLQQAGTNAVATLIDQADGTAMSVAKALSNMGAAATAFVGNNLTNAANAGQQILNSLFGGFGIGAGGPAAAATPVQATQAVVSAQQNIADNASGLAALQAQLNQAANGGGTSVTVNFTGYPNGALPSTFTVDSGSSEVSSGYAVATVGPAIVQYNDAETETDQQIISGIFTSVSGDNRAGLRGRVNSAGTTYVQAVYIPGNSEPWYLSSIVAGASHFLAYGADVFTPGAVYSLVCGTGVGPNRTFQILKNGTPIQLYNSPFSSGALSVIDTFNDSQIGSGYRRGGYYLKGTAKLSTWALADNTPPAIVGSGFRAYRTASTTLTNSGGSPALFPGSWFDTTDYVSSDLTHDSSSNKVTVSVSGHYRIQMVLHAASYVNWGASNYLFGTLYVNGTRVRTGNNLIYGYKLETSYDIYLEAGDYVQLGYVSNTNFSANGDAGGLITWWSVTFLNRGTLS